MQRDHPKNGHRLPATTRTRSSPRKPPHLLTPQRRITRSRSRQLDAARDESTAGNAQRARSDARSEELAPISEEPSSISAAMQSPSRKFEYDTIPESPDEHDFSGTTFLPTDSEPEMGDLDPFVIVDALSDLHRAADGVLDLLAPSSVSLASILEMTKKLQDPRSSQSRRLDRVSNFSSEINYFGRQTYIDVAHVARVLPSVEIPSTSESSQAGSWAGDGILYKVNCARLALEILTASSTKNSLEPALYNLEGKFPAPYMSNLVKEASITDAGTSSLRRETFDLALDIRTHFLKMSLERHLFEEAFDPNAVLKHVFFDEMLEEENDQPALRGFNIAALQDESGLLPSHLEDDVYERIRHVRRFFRDEAAVDLEGWEAAFPWSEFLLHAVKWVRMRVREINRHLSQQTSVDEVRDLLEHDTNQRGSPADDISGRRRQDSLSPPRPVEIGEWLQTGSESPSPKGKKKRSPSKGAFLIPSAILRLIKREEILYGKQQQDQQSISVNPMPQHASRGYTSNGSIRNRSEFSPLAERAYSKEKEIPASPEGSERASCEPGHFAVDDFSTEPSGNTIHHPPRINPSTTALLRGVSQEEQSHQSNADLIPPSSREVLDVITQYKASTSKNSTTARDRTAFNDRQTNATRISPISDISPGQGRTANRKKRRRIQTPSTESDDEPGFSTYERCIDVNGKRTQKPRPSPSKRTKLFNENSDEEAGSQFDDELVESSNAPRPLRSTSHQVLNSGSASASRGPSRIRGTLAATISSIPSLPMPQRRQRWLVAENERLIHLVGKHGPSWAKIKREDELWPDNDGGPQLTRRDQVQLKDRARNIVMEYYRTGQPPPPNFDMVPIRKSDKDKLRSMGIEVTDLRDLILARN